MDQLRKRAVHAANTAVATLKGLMARVAELKVVYFGLDPIQLRLLLRDDVRLF